MYRSSVVLSLGSVRKSQVTNVAFKGSQVPALVYCRNMSRQGQLLRVLLVTLVARKRPLLVVGLTSVFFHQDFTGEGLVTDATVERCRIVLCFVNNLNVTKQGLFRRKGLATLVTRIRPVLFNFALLD